MTSAAEQGHPGDEREESRSDAATSETAAERSHKVRRHTEVGGPAGPEPTRYGDWERAGRCIDF